MFVVVDPGPFRVVRQRQGTSISCRGAGNDAGNAVLVQPNGGCRPRRIAPTGVAGAEPGRRSALWTGCPVIAAGRLSTRPAPVRDHGIARAGHRRDDRRWRWTWRRLTASRTYPFGERGDVKVSVCGEAAVIGPSPGACGAGSRTNDGGGTLSGPSRPAPGDRSGVLIRASSRSTAVAASVAASWAIAVICGSNRSAHSTSSCRSVISWKTLRATLPLPNPSPRWTASK
jgi:hypothetical protein